MFNRRQALGSLAAALFGSVMQISGARADQSFQRFFPFLVDLDGWQGKKPDGISMELPGNTMITATREYQRGPARFHAQVLVGAAAKGALAVAQSGMKIETSDGRMSTTSRTSPAQSSSLSAAIACSASPSTALPTMKRSGSPRNSTGRRSRPRPSSAAVSARTQVAEWRRGLPMLR
jgi:hypothetical protein